MIGVLLAFIVTTAFPVEPALPANAVELARRPVICDGERVGITSLYDLDGNPETFEVVTWSSDRLTVFVYRDDPFPGPGRPGGLGTTFLIYPATPPAIMTLTYEGLLARFPNGFCEAWRNAPRP